MGRDRHQGLRAEQAGARRPFLTQALQDDPALRRDAEACLALGVSPRRFDGWEPQQHTTVTAWDAEGRPASWRTTTQPEWDAEDRAIVQALLDLKADTCDGCGQRLSESLFVDGQQPPEWEHPFLMCTGCASKERVLHKLEERDRATEKHGGFVPRLARKFITRRRRT